MPQYRRTKTPGGIYFFTVNTHRRRPILTLPIARQALRLGIQRARQTLPFDIEAFVLLPDHLHTIWTLPEDDANCPARWAIIKREVSKRCIHLINLPEEVSASRQRRQEYGIWQRRFWEHQIRDEVDFQRHVDYIHWNPVKHGLVHEVVDWPYSTFHRYLARGVYPPDWGGVVTDSKDDTIFGE
ncbi:MAG: transposase [Desulfobacca sp.]|nr:transposase [Desulfobacca sp.]